MDNTILAFLKTLPENNEPKFTARLSNYLLKNDEDINSLKKKVQEILEKEENITIKFSAYYALMIIYRRYQDPYSATILTIQYKDKFENIPLFVYQESRVYVDYNDEASLLKALNYAQKAIDLLNGIEYAGFYHNYAEIVAILCETHNKLDKKMIEQAFNYIDKAISINSDYAKYYSTLGRLQTCQGNYRIAEMNLNKAIGLEDASLSDYTIRISKYQNLLIRNEMTELHNNLENKYTKIENDFQRSKNSIIEFLSFFAAIIAMIFTSVQISLSFKFIDAATLLIILGGVLIIAFGMISCILKSDKEGIIKSIVFFVIGLLMIVLSLIIHSYC